MKYIDFSIKSKIENRENILNILYSMDIYVFEEYGEHILQELNQDEKSWDFIDKDVFKLDPNELIIKVYFSPEEKDKYLELERVLKEKGFTDLLIREEDDVDWSNNWKKYYHTLEIGKKIAIKPCWEVYENKDNRVIVEIDPGMAFGTGSHETTYLCLEALEKYIEPQDKVFDIGCGSGILAIAAIKLGAESALCVDIDENCIKASKNNAKLNKVDDRITIYKGNLLDKVEGKADVIISNIIAEIIAEMIPKLNSHLNKGGRFILSGIIHDKIGLIKSALEREGLELVEIKEKNEWVRIIGRK
ncbi:50S ribosomal protein L11 methyltransferase [Peptoniphilus catoniae]|uniref:50S ribosomal protein L11 methyltransferase n=1 Tax=Peptoniphilus catoniae TaxID=1660341 RepID=UPI0010FEB9BD|nr:50S ribosomal protein L11 methyltransferase [Peptoniphilus catoniae]